jgi:hypothetical protein
MATGENNTTWGDVTNLNLGTALEEAIVGSADVTFASADVTLTLTDTNASQTARNMRLRCTGTTGGSTRNLVVPSIEKPYIVRNDCADSVVVKTTAGTGITVPAGKTMWVYSDATNVVDAVTHLSSLTLGTDLAVSDGGTGASTFTANGVIYGNTTSALLATAAGTTGQVLVGNTGGAPSWATLTGIGVTSFSAGTTGLTPNTATTGAVTLAGTLGVANGGTGTSTAFTAGSVVFAGASGVYTQDNANLFWDNTNDRLGIGTASPAAPLSITRDNAAFRGQLSLQTVSSGNFAQLTFYDQSTLSAQIYQGYGSDKEINIVNPLTAGIALWTTNAERVRITAGGDVGIGTTAPATKLQIQETTGTSGFESGLSLTNAVDSNLFLQITGSASTDKRALISTSTVTPIAFATNSVERMRINTSGNVGIGTSSPVGKLTTVSTAGFTAPNLLCTDTVGTFRIVFQSSLYAAVPANKPWLHSYDDMYIGSDATTSFNVISGGVNRFNVNSSGNVGVGTTAQGMPLEVIKNGTDSGLGYSNVSKIADGAGNKGLLVGYANSEQTTVLTANSSSASSNMAFWTYDAGGSGWGERVRIAANGNVGIGTSSPAAKLDVNGNIIVRASNDILDTGVFGNAGYIQTYNNASGIAAIPMRFLTGTAERMRIDSSGNVGIGTSSPSYLLHLNQNGNTQAWISATNSGSNSAGIGFENQGQRNWQIWADRTTDTLSFGQNSRGSNYMSMTGNGLIGIGTSAPQAPFGGRALQVGTTTDARAVFTLQSTTSGLGSIYFSDGTTGGDTFVGYIDYDHSGNRMSFGTGATERMRIDSSGNLLVGTTDAGETTGVGLKLFNSAVIPTYRVVMDTATSSQAPIVIYNVNATNNGYRFYVRSDGGIANFQANDINLSDERLKKDIELAGDYLDKICAIPVKSFLFKDQPDQEKTLGVLAQDVDAVAPELVDHDGFGETPDGEAPYLSIYQTDLQYALMKCIQELKAKNDELRARVAQLEGN